MKNIKPDHKQPIVCLDAGHYGKYNRSPVVPAYYESTMVWALHNYLAAELERYGVQVKKTRANQEKDMLLVARGEASKGCDLFLSIHSNAASNESTDYVVAMYQVDDNCGLIDDQSRAVAGLLADCVAKVMGASPKTWSTKSSADRDGNGYKDDYYGVLRGAHNVGTAGVIIEHGFHTNKAQATWLLDDSNLRRLAAAEAAVIAEWFGMDKPAADPQEKPAAEPEHWYRIRKTWADAKSQTAAYKDLGGAKKACPVGYSVYDWNGKAVYTNTPAPEAAEKDADGYSVKMRYLRKGCKGDDVRALQLLLIANGCSCGKYGADGDFGGATDTAVREYQRKAGLAVDGAVGPDTMRSLLGVK